MSKSKKRAKFSHEYDDDYDVNDRRSSVKRDMERRRNKRIKNALRTRDIDSLMNQEDY